MFSTRRSDDSGDANILYYNEGIGYGYAMCIDCGKMCIETGQEEEGKASIPKEIDDKENYHFAIDREKKHRCFGSGKKDRIKRNVIIGDLMQTDYCEIRLRHKGDKCWIHHTNTDEDNQNYNLLTTLGIVFCQALVELKGWERGSVDFSVMPNKHLCIFDTNPGGAGYSVKLHDNHQTMLDVIAGAKKFLEKAQAKDCKDMLLDKFTLRFLKYIDIEGALAWINEQEEAKDIYPDPIPSVFDIQDVRQSSVRELRTAFAASTQKMTLFVDDNYSKWDFGTSNSGWQGRLLGDFFAKRSNTTFCVAKKKNADIPEGIKQMLRDIKVIFDAPVAVEYKSDKDIYPLAYIDGRLYFTINDESSSLNECWGDGVLYCIKCDNPAVGAQEIDCRMNEETTQIFFLDDAESEIKKSSEIAELIYTHDDMAKRIIDKFITHCKNSNGDLHITYQDEHLKSVAAMVLTLQTIEFFVKKIHRDFDLEFLIEEYNYGTQKRGIFANLINSYKRDNMLQDKAESWINYMDYEHEIIGQLNDVKSAPAGSLTHWRVLNIECNGKRLSIYPDGGLLNGWGFDKANSTKYYDETTCHNDYIPIIRQQNIKYEVHIEDICNQCE